MRVILLGCGYLGYNLSLRLKESFPTEMWGIDSPYVPLCEDFTEVNAFDPEAMAEMDVKDAVIIDTVALIGNNAKSDDEEAVLGDIRRKYEELLAVLKKNGAKMFIFFSSGGTVYGDVDHPAMEFDPVKPISLYAKSKVMLEKVIKDSGLDYLNLRLGNPYGGYQLKQKRQGVIPILIRKALQKEEFHMWIDGSSRRDYFYIDDLAAAITLLLQKDIRCETINVGSGMAVSLDEVIAMVERETGCVIPVIREEIDVPVVESNMLSIEKLQRLTGYEPGVMLARGIHEETMRIKEEESL